MQLQDLGGGYGSMMEEGNLRVGDGNLRVGDGPEIEAVDDV